MSAIRLSVEDLLSPAETAFAGALADHVRATTGQGPSKAEVLSWRNSLPVLAEDLVAAGLGGVTLLAEYKLPLSSRRVDVLLAGAHPETGADSYVLVELKQWTQAELSELGDRLVLTGGREVLHPAEQVRRYGEYLVDFLDVLTPESVSTAAYLHNAMDLDVADLAGEVFTGSRREMFRSFLRSRLAPDSGDAAAERLLGSPVAPSRQLMAHAAKEIREREQFTLLDEQQVAFELVMRAVDTDEKRVVIVTGGPGSGKSVIALSLLGELFRRGRTALHATGSQSFTETMRRYPGRGNTRIKNLFVYFNSLTDAKPDGLDVLVCDEAHRIRETSSNRFTPAAKRTGRPQLDELLSAAKVPVFLLDEHQVVRPGELGTVQAIEAFARSKGYTVSHVSLDEQFRCGGSRVYERWVLDLVGLSGESPSPWTGDPSFEVRLAGSPEELESILRGKSGTARMTAGYCWPWSDPRSDLTLVDDVVIGDWARPWNVKKHRAVGDAPPSMLWATEPSGFGQVGCVYTAQGFEYDWAGVILGPDLTVRDGVLATVRSANRDPAFKSVKSVPDAEFDQLVRNVYKVLLTRGMRGTVLYAVDPAVRRLLAELVP
ncbi:DUF2075 domain-containing protein [Herbidospora yilanensis]|uniref:DUF2075 domain-containing protein n=1 Tax=Herbidospora yilanensis TaxID=354426 RepID=UPI0009FCB67B|nr:DUF2075 domain-containing protein [Herbidospora yilanensis]